MKRWQQDTLTMVVALGGAFLLLGVMVWLMYHMAGLFLVLILSIGGLVGTTTSRRRMKTRGRGGGGGGE